VAEIEEALQAGHVHRLAPLDATTASSDDDEYAQAEARVSFQRLTAPLDARAREALRLRFEDDLHQHEIAARLGLSQVSVSRLLRASLAELQRIAGPPQAPEPLPVM